MPPGRAGRLWLRERLAAARKAADLLDHKRRELEAELERLETIATRRRKEWDDAWKEAEAWLSRIDAIGGEREVRLATSLVGEPAAVSLEWQQVMGARYPTDFQVSFPPEPPLASLSGGPALAAALPVHRKAAEAAVAHAVASSARERIRLDLERTARRSRALELRAIPTYERALARLEIALDEKSREEAVAARWAATGGPPVLAGGEEA